jgi:hypothetical protein
MIVEAESTATPDKNVGWTDAAAQVVVLTAQRARRAFGVERTKHVIRTPTIVMIPKQSIPVRSASLRARRRMRTG